MLFEGPKHKHLKCTIYRGEGGGGNATTDSEIALLTSLQLSAQASATSATASASAAAQSAIDADNSADAAALSEAAAAISESNAAASESAAAASEALAEDWATKTTGTVDGVEYSAKYYAQQAATFDPADFVDLVNNQTIGGTKTFSSTITGSISGNAGTVTNGVYTTGDQTIGGTKTFSSTVSGSINGNAATVTNGVYTTGNQTIGGVKTFSSTISGSISGNAGTATTATNIAGGAAGNIPMQTAAGTTSFYTGQLAGMRNKIINGKMEIAQRGTSFAAIANGAYSLDRWKINYVSAAVATVSQQSDVPSDNEFQSSLRVAVTTADTSIATGDFFIVRQVIEGYNLRDLIGRPFSFSFRVRSSKTGPHCISFSNFGADRSYVAEYTVSAANTWETKTITVSEGLPSAGTWNWTNSIGLYVDFVLAAGSAYQTTAGAWQTGNFVATSNQVNCLDTIGNVFAITGVQLEVGSVATPFEHRPYGAELALCQRYYYRMSFSDLEEFGVGLNSTTTVAFILVNFPVTLRSEPTALEQSGTAADYQVRYLATTTACSAVPAFSSATVAAARISMTVASGLTAGQASMGRGVSGAYLGFSAEL